MSFRNRAIFSKSKLLNNVEISFLDIGARGNLPPPWLHLEKQFPNRLKVAGFETDPEELAKLKRSFPKRKYFPVGLGKKDGFAKFYLNNGKSSSSLYRPNEETYNTFRDNHSSGRKVDREVKVKISSLDSIDLSSFYSSFVKIDVQGAELDILEGGKSFFRENAIGFTAETWTYEVYKDQPLIHDVMQWATQNNYKLYGLEETGRWDFRSSVPLNDRGVPVCVDLLYFRSLKDSCARDHL